VARATRPGRKSAKTLYRESTDPQFAAEETTLGPWTSYSLRHDPKHLAFVLSRYKFCAKMLHGKRSIMEVGCGDGFGLPLLAQAAGHVYAVDWDKRLLDGNARRLGHLKNVTYVHADCNEAPPPVKADALALIDVIEHLEPRCEAAFLENVLGCLPADGIAVVGTPNVTASAYASPQSEAAHINLKTMESLRGLMQRHFRHVFMFGMNDEVLHTGYGPMCHYLWAIGAGRT
jgi:2-polyprenyl-3-methyl-5-hydroxy-6-metoxy-1,4-benzoquinol methylase